MMPSVTLHPGTAAPDYVETLLDRNGLPVRDVRAHPEAFHYATVEGERIGVGGLERYDDVGLLRSVAVEAGKRGYGYGSDLCEALESKARATGVETLYLPTTASAFFAARGYAPIERTTVPDAIRKTTEFAELCPATATCMRKSL
jgi:amino-acid N-acetyltransferase